TLFATVAKDVRLRFECASGLHDVEVLGYDVVAENGSVVVPLENLYGGETRSVLLRIHLDPRDPGRFDLGSLRLDYTDCESNRTEDLTYRLRAEATEDEAAVHASVNQDVAAEAMLMNAEDEHEQAVRDFERGDKGLAKTNLAALSSKLEAANAVLHDERLEMKLQQLELESGDMDRADLDEANRQMYLKGSKNLLYNAKKGKRAQYMLQEADTGFEVEQLQNRLKELQIYAGPVDGRYSEEVRRAVEAYQGQNGYDPDGIAGPITLRALGLY
ncbi:MAG: peptidoglycan-binding protein, partial [Candidatus Eisenbacteria bacterium]|nr:peptidoglycan-binding protein [Candidatus Eisenbacteria bacterium]